MRKSRYSNPSRKVPYSSPCRIALALSFIICWASFTETLPSPSASQELILALGFASAASSAEGLGATRLFLSLAPSFFLPNSPMEPVSSLTPQ
jgi:hypothetical protein